MEVKVNEKLETKHEGLYVIGDGSGITHSLSHASASGVFVAREIAGENSKKSKISSPRGELFFVDMSAMPTRYICLAANSICSSYGRTRYDINPRSRSEHIECEAHIELR